MNPENSPSRTEHKAFLIVFATIAALIIGAVLSSCTLGPTKVVRVSPSGTRTEITTTGISVLTRSDQETTTITDGDFTASHTVTKKDEQGIIRIPAQQAIGTTAAGVIVPGINAVMK